MAKRAQAAGRTMLPDSERVGMATLTKRLVLGSTLLALSAYVASWGVWFSEPLWSPGTVSDLTWLARLRRMHPRLGVILFVAGLISVAILCWRLRRTVWPYRRASQAQVLFSSDSHFATPPRVHYGFAAAETAIVRYSADEVRQTTSLFYAELAAAATTAPDLVL